MAAGFRQVHADRLVATPEEGPDADPATGRRAGLKIALAGCWTVVPEDEHAAVQERADQWNSSLKLWVAHEGWLVEQIAPLTLRLERCQLQERARRELLAHRANTHWDVDRHAAEETLASSLSRSPAEVLRRRELTKHGCQALADRWARLENALDAQSTWTPSQRSQALDLLGFPAPFREVPAPADADTSALRELVATHLDRPADLRVSGLDAFDDLERTAAEAGLAPDPDPLLAHLHRLESSIARQLASCRTSSGLARPPTSSTPTPMPPAPAPGPTSARTRAPLPDRSLPSQSRTPRHLRGPPPRRTRGTEVRLTSRSAAPSRNPRPSSFRPPPPRRGNPFHSPYLPN